MNQPPTMRRSCHTSLIPAPIIIIPRKAALRFVEGSALETALKKVGHNLGRKEDSLQEHEYEEDYHGRHVGTSGGADDGGERKPTARKHNAPAVNASQSQKKFPEISTLSSFLGNSVNSIFLRPPHLFVGVGLVPVHTLPNGIASTDFLSLAAAHHTLLLVIPWKSSSQ